jgi:large subunit ribosomal protein L10
MAKIKQATKKTGKARKEAIVAELTEKMDSANGLVFTDYKGLTHQQLETLKKDLKTMDSTIIIAKNSLLRLSMGQSKNFADFKDNEALELPTATLFIRGDMVEPLKKLQKTVKELGLPVVKFGILEGQLVDDKGVAKIAALPSRDTLIAQFVGTLNSPIQGLVVTLNGTIQKFVMTLNAIAQNKPAAPAPSQEPASAPADTPAENTEEAAPAAEQSSDSPSQEPADAAAKTDAPEAEETPAKTTNEVSNEEAKTDDDKGGEN